MARIAFVGSYGVGMTMTVPRLPEAGETIVGGHFSLGPGGKGSNQAIGARRLGAEVDLLTCVGPDDLGAAGRELWRREGVGIERVKTGTRPTMVGFILVEPSGENRIAIAPGALDELTLTDVQGFAAEIERADLCVTCLEIPLEATLAALRVARAAGTPTLLNPAPAKPLPDEAWTLIDYLTPNRVEARALANLPECTSTEVVLDALRQRFSGVIALTLGADGALIDAGEGRAHVAPVAPRQVLDTTGAGDAFNAAFAMAISERWPVTDAAWFGNAAGAYAVGIAEVIPALPYRRDLPMPADRPRLP